VRAGVKHCSLEMGGKNIIIVLEDANLDLRWMARFGEIRDDWTAVYGGQPRGGTQKCLSRVYFALRGTRQIVTRGRWTGRHDRYGPCINEQQLKTVMSYVEIGKDVDGAKLLTGGNRLSKGADAKGWFHEPTVFGDCAPNMRIAQEEILVRWCQ